MFPDPPLWELSTELTDLLVPDWLRTCKKKDENNKLVLRKLLKGFDAILWDMDFLA